jgi:hypothetical protein
MIDRMNPPIDDDLVHGPLPVGATARRRVPLREKSFELAEQLARRGASESLIRMAGGDEAVEKLLDRNGSLRSA